MTYIYIYIYGGIVKFHMHWESIGNSENDNHCLNFKSNYDKMKITSIKVNLIKYFFMRNWVLKTLYSRGFTSIEVVFHCNGCIAFSGKFFSGGTSKEVRPLERGDSPRMSRRLRPVTLLVRGQEVSAGTGRLVFHLSCQSKATSHFCILTMGDNWSITVSLLRCHDFISRFNLSTPCSHDTFRHSRSHISCVFGPQHSLLRKKQYQWNRKHTHAHTRQERCEWLCSPGRGRHWNFDPLQC